MTEHEFHYDEDEHKYYVDGTEVPSVTKVLDHFIPSYYSKTQTPMYEPCPESPHMMRQIKGMELGKSVHEATDLHDRGMLNWDTLHPNVKTRVQAWAEFVDTFQWKSTLIEQKMCMFYPEAYMALGGRLDRMGHGEKVRKLSLEGNFILDLKVSDGVIKGAEIQTAMYGLLYQYGFTHQSNVDKYREITGRLVVYLRSDGRFKASRDLKFFDDTYEYDVARHMVSTYNWLIEKGYIKNE